jgi:hypothetical protein
MHADAHRHRRRIDGERAADGPECWQPSLSATASVSP